MPKRCLSFLLVFMMLMQSAAGVAAWHLDSFANEQEHHAVHSMEHAHHHEMGLEDIDFDHHQCQISLGGMALHFYLPNLTLVPQPLQLIKSDYPHRFTSALLDSALRPPIA